MVYKSSHFQRTQSLVSVKQFVTTIYYLQSHFRIQIQNCLLWTPCIKTVRCRLSQYPHLKHVLNSNLKKTSNAISLMYLECQHFLHNFQDFEQKLHLRESALNLIYLSCEWNCWNRMNNQHMCTANQFN